MRRLMAAFAVACAMMVAMPATAAEQAGPVKVVYHVNENNAPSVGLAEALGLVPFVTIEHFVRTS